MIRQFTIQIVVRIFLTLGLCVLMAFLIMRQQWFSATGTAMLISAFVYSLIQYVNNTNYTLVKFLEALKNRDYAVYFHQTQKGNSFKHVFNDFNAIIKMFKQNKIDKEAQFEYFRQILEQISIGIISILKSDVNNPHSEEEVLFLNRAACELLNQPRHSYWHRIAQQAPWLEREIAKLIDGGSKLVSIGKDHQQRQLAIEVTTVDLVGKPYLIITLKDILAEIEQKEMEAWHNIIRVLAHEMMNSFTPVSSLASTLKSMTEDEDGEVLKAGDLEDETVLDINLGVSTIKRRADGLLDFVNDYRTLSNVPQPHIKPVVVAEFFEHINRLMRPVIEENNIRFEIHPVARRLVIPIDSRLVEQIMINLMGNSIHALQHTEDPVITLSAEIHEDLVRVMVSDNGPGIPEDVRKQIFVPFFTTREKGSGIGLSLSKTIMKQHGGNIYMETEPNHRTTFTLVFPSK